MTAVSEVFDELAVTATPKGIPSAESSSARGVHAGRRAREDTRSRSVIARVRAWLMVVAADFKGAWVWRAQAPALLDLWRRRVPAIEKVPGENRALWWIWLVWNHAVLPVFAGLALTLWLLEHPARFAFVGTLIGVLVGMWIS
jgi:hypothetical protein